MENKVELLGYYGGDITIAQSAWTSTYRELTEEKRSRVGKLINMLWRDGHKTPFEKATVHFLVNTDIATHIHLLKHRIASINGESARYKEIKEDKYYLPRDWDGLDCNVDIILPSTGEEVAHSGDKWLDILERYTEAGNKLYHQAVEDLTPILGRKRAKESARFFKTYNSQIQADVMFNMSSFANFYYLRSADDAQLEIREIANTMMDILKNLEGNPFKYTLEAIELKK